jgi:signal transduction histidine kinase
MAHGQTKPFRAHNSAVECHLHTVEVVGSNPAVPTNHINNLADVTVEAFAAFSAALITALSLFRYRIQQITEQLNIRIDVRVSERTRIARELHDTLLQSFTAVLLRLQAVSNVLPTRPDEAKRRIEDAIEQADEAITEDRDAVRELRSSGITVGEPSKALANFAKELLSEAPPESVPEIVV